MMNLEAGEPQFAERYRAIHARDARFDGQFFTAVLTTGIYCRPSCPARTPKRENVRFYSTSAAAHEAGFRACKRCLPEAAPGTPEWDLRQDLASRAMRLIADGVVDREGVAGLAERLGYTPRHVNRLLIAELGAGPIALARARRAQSARALLVGSDLPVSHVAFAAGFGSVRQCNDTVRAVFAASPLDIRARARNMQSSTVSGDGRLTLTLDLPVRQPFEAHGVFRFLEQRVVEGIEVADLSDDRRLRYARTLLLPHGPAAAQIEALRRGPEWHVIARLELSSLADVAPAVARIRRLLDLDADPAAVDASLVADPVLAASVAETPGIRVPGAVDAHEMVVRAIVGQQISVVAAHRHLSRLVEHVGQPYTSSFEGLTKLFPSPGRIAESVAVPEPEETLDPDRPLRLPRASIAAIVGASAAFADGSIDVHLGLDPDDLRQRLARLSRIGDWTAAYISMRVLGDPDAWMVGDVALIAGAKRLGLLDTGAAKAVQHRQLAETATVWAPWRSYAAMHIWKASKETP
ncbi:MAG TPA: helix-turn-helix domain-containing protein [Candidatus Agrococcus pullicola]|uniref:DNA-3-methyladenine glycosylase II n=1 Tax=Candidatus Agrococcus pullicola TaxID=2838429 RepID=A0A9D1YUP0_9MICO|nr:helix-turn-helix domain-containing protein [Candidatus Agrococcus pullicola]